MIVTHSEGCGQVLTPEMDVSQLVDYLQKIKIQKFLPKYV